MSARFRRRRTIAAMAAWRRIAKDMDGWVPVRWFDRRSPRRRPQDVPREGAIGRFESFRYIGSPPTTQPQPRRRLDPARYGKGTATSHRTTKDRPMKMTRLLSFAFAAALAVASCAAAAVDFATHAAVSAYRWGAKILRNTFAGPVEFQPAAQLEPQVRRTAARQFVARVLKRERPTISSSWRMCPST